MNFTLDLFYIFSFVLVSSALATISARNMVHAAMFLILAFVNASALFILLGAEFLAMLLIVVYVGAIAVLFLFVVMMLNVDVKRENEVNRKRPIFILVGAVLFAEILLIIKFSTVKFYETKTLFPTPTEISNTATDWIPGQTTSSCTQQYFFSHEKFHSDYTPAKKDFTSH
jgi:NADH-quinone oxidoreductase subunit J